MTTATEPTKHVPAAPTPPPPPLLPTWIAYPSAGLCFVAAGFLWTSLPAFMELYYTLSVPLPFLVQFQLSFPRLLPLGLVGGGLLALGATRRLVAARSPRTSAALAAIFLGLCSILMVLINNMTVRALQSFGARDPAAENEAYAAEKMAWADKIVAAKVSVAGEGEPLSAVFATLAEQAKVRIRVARSLRALPCNTPIRGAPLEDALTALSRTQQLQVYRADPRDLIIVPARPSERVLSQTFRDLPLETALKLVPIKSRPPADGRRRLITFRFAHAPAGEVIEVLAILAGCRIERDAQAGHVFVPNSE